MSILAVAYVATLLGVTDGDTLRARVEVWPGVEVVTAVRLAGIDTPELKGRCLEERTAAQAAKARLSELVARGKLTIEGINPDKFAGRVDALVRVDGRDIAEQLVTEGLARRYAGGARQSWCA